MQCLFLWKCRMRCLLSPSALQPSNSVEHDAFHAYWHRKEHSMKIIFSDWIFFFKKKKKKAGKLCEVKFWSCLFYFLLLSPKKKTPWENAALHVWQQKCNNIVINIWNNWRVEITLPECRIKHWLSSSWTRLRYRLISYTWWNVKGAWIDMVWSH